MTQTPRIGVILGSTRDSRFGLAPAEWIVARAKARGDWDVDLIDLKDHPLPLFNEMASNLWMPSEDPAAVKWQQTLAQYDGFIFVTPEYNHSITAVLKKRAGPSLFGVELQSVWHCRLWRCGGCAPRAETPACHRDRAANGVYPVCGSYRRRRFLQRAPDGRRPEADRVA